jgi:hypothetical protein
MRASIVLATASASLAIIAACAGSEDEATPSGEAPPASIPEGGAPDVDVPDVDVPDTRLPDCSSAGWCITPFSDENLDFRDIWPLEDVAFAIAESRTEGVKFLEWKKSTNAWEYIDDLSQNGAGSGTFAGGVYAPNADEVYFAVGSAYVYHGKRAAPPETKWTWTRAELPDNVVGHPTTHDHGRPYYSVPRAPTPAFGVWGAGAADVYAHYSNTIFRRDPADGTWSAVYTVADLDAADEHAFFVGASGTGPDDIWFVGSRDRSTATRRNFHCPLVVRKTAEGWERVADGVVTSSSAAPCGVRAGTPRIGNAFGGWITDIQPVSATEYLALHNGRTSSIAEVVNLTRVRVSLPSDGGLPSDDGGIPSDDGLSFEQSLLPVKLATSTAPPNGPPKIMSSLWRGDGETWFTSWGLVARRTDDDTLSVSTLSRDGAPVRMPFHKIRGTSNQNLWAVGARHAYHKTTP